MRSLVSGEATPPMRDRATEALARAQNIPPEEAHKQVLQYEEQYRQAVQQAKSKATEVAAPRCSPATVTVVPPP